MKLYKNKLLFSIIEEEYKKIVKEQEEKPDEAVNDAAPNDMPEVGNENEDNADNDIDVDIGAEPDVEETGDTETDLDISVDDAGASTGGGGFGGGRGKSFGGGDFGKDDDETGLKPDDSAEKDTATTVGPEDVEIPNDPVMSIANDAIEMLNHTRQPGPILQNVKHSVQRYFPEPSAAAPIIKALYDTEDLVLRDVARRLMMFIKGI